MKSYELLDNEEPPQSSAVEAGTFSEGLYGLAPTRYTRADFSFLCRPSPKKEPSKVVLEKPWKRFLDSCLLHSLPLAICIGLIWLDRRQYFWFEGERPITMNSLQFAAKVLELLILGSLSAMVLHHARRHLIGANGLPIGLLSASYRVTDVLLVTESAFWSSLFRNGTWRLGLFILFIALFSVVVGPSAAIAFLPTPGWYSFPTAFSNATNRVLFLRNNGSSYIQTTTE